MYVTQVERFKLRQSWEDALHARFDCYTGDPVTSDDEWGHLQVSLCNSMHSTRGIVTLNGRYDVVACCMKIYHKYLRCYFLCVSGLEDRQNIFTQHAHALTCSWNL